MATQIFISYASENRSYKADRELFDEFVRDVINEVNQTKTTAGKVEEFLAHRDIESGDEWPTALADAVRASRVMLSFFSPHYFNSTWCGREFQVFMDRRKQWAPSANDDAHVTFIVPVLWIACTPPDQIASSQQNWDSGFPQEYRDLGARKLLQLDKKAERVAVVTSLAARIVKLLGQTSLPDLAALGAMGTLASAFDAANGGPTQQASPAYFVFAAGKRTEIATTARNNVAAWANTDGKDWRPFFPQSPESVGALAQRAAGDKARRFKQIPCDAQLTNRLKLAKQENAPVVIFADPWTFPLQPYRQALADYDLVNLLNCSMLVPWNADDNETTQQRAALMSELRQVLPQKFKQKYPGHYWEINSFKDFQDQVLTVLDEITLRLVDDAADGVLRKAESAELELVAKEQGISTGTPAQLQNSAPLDVD
jgi:FxsC-like protein